MKRVREEGTRNANHITDGRDKRKREYGKGKTNHLIQAQKQQRLMWLRLHRGFSNR